MKKDTTIYTGTRLQHIAYPLGGMGSGMFCLTGTGAYADFSLRHKPNLQSDSNVFAALAVKQEGTVTARVLEGDVPRNKIWNSPNPKMYRGRGCGLGETNYGLPRFGSCEFQAQFPFARVNLKDEAQPVAVSITSWSPFIPSDEDNSSLPCATVEYAIENISDTPIECVFYFTALNMVGLGNGRDGTEPSLNGFTLFQTGTQDCPWDEAYFRVVCGVDSGNIFSDTALYRGGWYDTRTMIWNTIQAGCYESKRYDTPGTGSPGGLLALPFVIQPAETKTVPLHFIWYVPNSNLRESGDAEPLREQDLNQTFKPWYSVRFTDVNEVSAHYLENVQHLREQTERFTNTLYTSSIPPVLLEAVGANLSILKSPTVLRQHDGRFWAWEGSGENTGSCHGTCTHVWNYTQALCHLFPRLARRQIETELFENQNDEGHQQFRTSLPIRTCSHNFHAAADGQLGGLLRLYREWRISGDTTWMLSVLPRAFESLEYCIREWDKDESGIIRAPHHNTYDIEFYGAEPLCTLIYLGALRAASAMAETAGNMDVAVRYETLREKGAAFAREHLYNGEYMEQTNEYRTIPPEAVIIPMNHGAFSEEARELMRKEGPKYQYGAGCLADGVLGAWMAMLYGLGEIMDNNIVRSHLLSVFRHNYKENLRTHANTQRPGFAMSGDGGLLLCTWPRGEKPSLPFIYSDEVWTGIEYQVASHLICEGFVEEGVRIVDTLRKRYDGTTRNPFDEYECGHWYARALASFALLQSYSGVRYDNVTKTLYIAPVVAGDVQTLICFEDGYGLAGVRHGKPFFTAVQGELDLKKVEYINS